MSTSSTQLQQGLQHRVIGFGFWDLKHLQASIMDDTGMLGLGYASLVLFAFALKQQLNTREKPLTARLLPMIVTALSLSVAVACLGNLGMDERSANWFAVATPPICSPGRRILPPVHVVLDLDSR